jgi:hypothetical protein
MTDTNGAEWFVAASPEGRKASGLDAFGGYLAGRRFCAGGDRRQ